MTAPQIARRRRFVPPNAQVDWSHPLSQGLVWASHGPRGRNLVTGDALVPTGTPTHDATRYGTGIKCSGGAFVSGACPQLATGNSVSLHLLVRFDAMIGAYTALFDKGVGGSRDLSIFYDFGGNVNYTAVAESNDSNGYATGFVEGQTHDYVFTWDLVTTTTCHYVDGALKATATQTAGGGASASDLAFGGNPSGGGLQPSNTYAACQVWRGRTLRATDVAMLFVDPFCMMRLP